VNLNQEDIRYCNSHKQMLGIIPKNPANQKRKKKENGSEEKKEKKEGNSDSETEVDEEGNSKKKRKFLNESDTESDVPSSDDEFIESTPYLHTFKKTEHVSEEEFLEMRKERIESLLKIYYSQYKKIKFNLQNKYLDFIKQKERMMNNALNVNDETFKLSIESKKFEPIQMSESDSISFSTQCVRVAKIDSTGNSLCDFSNCTEKRLLCSEFCFKRNL
jgi:hypothetical protein